MLEDSVEYNLTISMEMSTLIKYIIRHINLKVLKHYNLLPRHPPQVAAINGFNHSYEDPWVLGCPQFDMMIKCDYFMDPRFLSYSSSMYVTNILNEPLDGFDILDRRSGAKCLVLQSWLYWSQPWPRLEKQFPKSRSTEPSCDLFQCSLDWAIFLWQ